MAGCNGETALISEPFPGSVSPGRDLDCSVDLSTIITANEMHNRSGRWDNIVCWGAAGGKLNRALLGVLVSGYSIALSLRGSAPPSAMTLSLSLSLPRSSDMILHMLCVHLQSMFHWWFWVKSTTNLHLLILSSSCTHTHTKKVNEREDDVCHFLYPSTSGSPEPLLFPEPVLPFMIFVLWNKCSLSNNKGTATTSEK